MTKRTEDDTQAAIVMIQGLSELNPEGDPRGLMDPTYTKACADWLPDRESETPLTLEGWKALREADDVGPAFARNIQDAVDPMVFLAVLRDRLVHTAGSAGVIISLISTLLDTFINAREMVWRTGDEPEDKGPQHLTIEEAADALPTVEMLNGLGRDDSIDLLYGRVDDALWAGDADKAWPHLETWVGTLNPNDLSTELLVGILVSLLPMRNQRQPWYSTRSARVEATLQSRELQDRQEGLLRGLGPHSEVQP